MNTTFYKLKLLESASDEAIEIHGVFGGVAQGKEKEREKETGDVSIQPS